MPFMSCTATGRSLSAFCSSVYSFIGQQGAQTVSYALPVGFKGPGGVTELRWDLLPQPEAQPLHEHWVPSAQVLGVGVGILPTQGHNEPMSPEAAPQKPSQAPHKPI